MNAFDSDPQPTLEDVQRYLRSHLQGEMQFDEHIRPVKIAIGPGGRVAGPVMVAMLESVDSVLFLPEANEGTLQIMVSLEQFDERGENGNLADRWRIYHGEPDDVRWALFHFDAARFRGLVIDGDALVMPNSLAGIEPAACREVNVNRRDALCRFVREVGGIELLEPVMVGFDPHGIDVRGPFDVVRVEFENPITAPEDALNQLIALLGA